MGSVTNSTCLANSRSPTKISGRSALASGKAVGIEITICNPRLDEDGSAGRGLADLLAWEISTSLPISA